MNRVFGSTRVTALAVLSLLACFTLVGAQLTGGGIVSAIAKCTASTAFIGVALWSGALDSTYGRIILAALVLSWFGDMFLLGSDATFFLGGLASFLLGHAVYIVAFSHRGLSDRWMFAALAPVVVASLLAMVWLGPNLPDNMIIPVRAYTLVISLMVVTAWGARGAGGPWLIPAGATLFYVSDLSVAAMQFADPGWPTYVLGLPFYYTGQLLLAASARFARKQG
jgi:uncharacterized membrane protein YhhN